jgi:hypothetical protein
MWTDRVPVRDAIIESVFVIVRLEYVQRPSFSAFRNDVDQNHRVIRPFTQFVRKMHTAKADVDHAEIVRQSQHGQSPDDLHAEGVVTQKDVSQASNEHSGDRHRNSPAKGCTSSGKK